MTRTPQERPFRPDPEQVALLPGVPGNAINGLGETEARRPTPVYHHDGGRIAHGALQDWFLRRGRPPEVARIRDESLRLARTRLPDPAPERPTRAPGDWTDRVKVAALAREADQVGIARLDADWVFKGFTLDYEWIIVLAVAMDYAPLAQAPGPVTQAEVQRQYLRGSRAAFALARWIREQGWDALPHGGPRAGPVLMIPAAIAAGLGELGKHGSMINRAFGSSFRLACVMTDMPLVADRPLTFGAADFCTACQVCVKACPVDAIFRDKQTVRGARKWYVDFDKCVLYFNEHNGCAVCIARCPWSVPGTAPRLAEKMASRRAARD